MHDYIQWKKSTLASGSVHNYERWIKRYEKFRKEENHSIELVGRFKLYLQVEKYAPKNVQYGLSILRDYIGYEMAAHGLQFPIKLFKIKQERSNSHQPITQEELTKILTFLPANEPVKLQRRLMLCLLWDTGMRVGELLRLRMSEIQGREAIILNEKNTRSRLIAWTPETDKLMKKYLALRKHLDATEDWVFVSFRWKPCGQMTTRHVERFVEDLRMQTGITKKIRPHSFRHGFTHRQLDAGKPITTVAQMLGHSTSMNVMTYAKLTGIEIRQAWGI